MKRVPLIAGAVLLVGLTLASGLLQGRASGRWGPPPQQLDAGASLKEIPDQFGPWRLKSAEAMSEQVTAMLECTGYVLRTYVNPQSGAIVHVTVIVGPSGPTSVHTPEICYSSQNHKVVEERKRVPLRDASGTQHEFWTVAFRSNDLEAHRLQVYYGWSAGDRWSAPEQPRFAFATSPHLYKLQLAAYLPSGAGPQSDDPCVSFLRDFLPQVKTHMVRSSNR